ncbi:MAG: hypothetical protein ACRD1P_10420 [Thermoanaerobaculia bacterium]
MSCMRKEERISIEIGAGAERRRPLVQRAGAGLTVRPCGVEGRGLGVRVGLGFRVGLRVECGATSADLPRRSRCWRAMAPSA